MASVATRAPRGDRTHLCSQRTGRVQALVPAPRVGRRGPRIRRGRPAAGRTIRRLLPGPVTLIVRRPGFVDHYMTRDGTMGLRVPDHPVCSAILERCGPFAGTSANRSGSPALLRALGRVAHGRRDGRRRADPLRCESTILDLSAGEPESSVKEQFGDDVERVLGRSGAPTSVKRCSSARARGVCRLLGAGAPPAKTPPAKPAASAAKPTPSTSPSPGSLPGEFNNVGGFDMITTRSIDTNLNTGVFTVPQRFTATRQRRSPPTGPPATRAPRPSMPTATSSFTGARPSREETGGRARAVDPDLRQTGRRRHQEILHRDR